MKKKRGPGEKYWIPAKFYNNEEWVPLDHPTVSGCICYTDTALREELQVSRAAFERWKREGIIPNRGVRGGYPEYHLKEVVEALKKAGYPQEDPTILQKGIRKK